LKILRTPAVSTPITVPVTCPLISESVAHKKTPRLLFVPADSHPGLLLGYRQSLSTNLAAVYIDLNVAVSYSAYGLREAPGRSKALVLNQSSSRIDRVQEPGYWD